MVNTTHVFSDRLYGGLRLDAQYDGIAGVDYRAKITPMVGYYLIKNEKMDALGGSRSFGGV